MSTRLPRFASDAETLKPIIEALIFASEEPLPARLIVQMIEGDRTRGTRSTEEIAEPEGDVVKNNSTPDNVEQPDQLDTESLDNASTELADAMEQAIAPGKRPPPSREIDTRFISAVVAELNRDYHEGMRAFRIVEIAGGFQFATLREYGEYVALLSKEKARRRLSPAALETLAIIAYRQPVSKPEVESIRGVNCDQVLLNLMEKNLAAIVGRSETVGRPLLYGTTEDFLRTFGLKGIGDLPKLREIEELMEQDAYSAERAEVIIVDADTGAEEIEARVGAAGLEQSDTDNTDYGTMDNNTIGISLIEESRHTELAPTSNSTDSQ